MNRLSGRPALIIRAVTPWAAYLAVTLVLVRVLLPVLGEKIPGTTDGWQNIWNYWWARYSLLDLHTNPFYSDYIYYPTGSSLLFHTFAPLSGWLAIPLTVLLGPLTTANLVSIASFVLCGMAAFALARGLGLSAFGAWMAGAVFAFCNPARWQYFGAGQSGQTMQLWMPLYILCLVKATRAPAEDETGHGSARPPWKWIAGGALCLLANGLTDLQYFVYMVLFTGLYALYLLLRDRARPGRWLALRNLALAAGGGVLLLSPLLVATLVEAATTKYAARPPSEAAAHSWDLTAFFTPNGVNPLWGGWASQQGVPGNSYGIVQGIGNGGYLPLLLGVIGVVLCWRRTWLWAVIAGVFALLTLGPTLRVAGIDTGIPSLYSLLQLIPFFNIGRDPGRFSLVAYLCLGVLAGFGVDAIASRLRGALGRPVARVALAGLAAIVATGEFVPLSYPMAGWPTSEFHYALARDTRDYALLEMPLADKFYVEYIESLMSIHHKRTLGGQTARKPCHCFDAETPVVRWFWDMKLPGGDDVVSYPDPATYAPGVLRAFNIRYIVLYKQTMSADDYATSQKLVETTMPGARPVADDSVLAAYSVPLTATTDVLPISLLSDWGEREPAPTGSLRWAGENGSTLVTVNARQLPDGTEQTRRVRLMLQLYPFQQARTLKVSLNGADVGVYTLKPELQTVTVNLALQPGSNKIRLYSPEPGISPQSLDPKSADTRRLTFAVTHMEFQEGW